MTPVPAEQRRAGGGAMSNEQIYDERIAPLMAQVIAICKEAGIPMVATFQLDNSDDPLMCSTVIPGENKSAWMGHLQTVVASRVPHHA
jgi:hypothetical protein